MIHMKCQALFSQRKTNSIMSSATLVNSILKSYFSRYLINTVLLITLDKKEYKVNIFSFFSGKTYVVGIH